MEKYYDYIVVGSGLFGATCAQKLHEEGKSVLVVEKRNHIAGNIYTENVEGINVHKYGAHIFHTSNQNVWEYVNKFAKFNSFINSPIANFHNELYPLPFNMNTFVKIWDDVKSPEDAQRHIEEEKESFKVENPKNLEEQAINLVGKTIYEKLIKGYTAKQWGRPCDQLPAFIIKRVPVRFTYDNNYFNDVFQGIPIGGYTKLVSNMLEGIDVKLNFDFLEHKEEFDLNKTKVIFTGPIDAFFNYKFGPLEYRSLEFKTELMEKEYFQNNAVINYTDYETPFTRIIEHKYFENTKASKTIVTWEYPQKWDLNKEPYYPVNNDENMAVLQRYLEESKKYPNIIFGGRLGMYKYFDMDKTIAAAFDLLSKL